VSIPFKRDEEDKKSLSMARMVVIKAFDNYQFRISLKQNTSISEVFSCGVSMTKEVKSPPHFCN
jgi:hypothetical protein